MFVNNNKPRQIKVYLLDEAIRWDDIGDESIVLEGRAGGPHLNDSLCEIFVMLLQPFKVGVFMLHSSSLADQAANCIQTLYGEVVPDQIRQIMLAAAIKHDGKLLNYLAHIGQ